MNILVSGSTGLIGSALVPFLIRQGHRVTRLVRTSPPPGERSVRWDPESGTIDLAGLESVEAVVHLAGDPIAKGRWTPEKKVRIRNSRVQGTRLVAQTIARFPISNRPKALLCASAIGYYGDRGNELLPEESPSGRGFLAATCQEWEASAEPAVEGGIRVVHLRFGIVMSPKGGALAMMLPPFRMGLGGKLGSGKQFMSWISIDDVVEAIHHTLATPTLRGAVNVVAPNPVTNLEFTKMLGRVLRRPTIFPVPAFAARLAFGELADEALLASARVEPARLKASGYRFRHPDLEGALRDLLKTGR